MCASRKRPRLRNASGPEHRDASGLAAQCRGRADAAIAVPKGRLAEGSLGAVWAKAAVRLRRAGVGNGRRKSRTHVKTEGSANAEKTPKSFVVRSGEVSRAAGQLVRDIRKVMEPNTASRLQERKRNKLKDYTTMAGPMGVSHFLLLSQTDTTTNLRIAKFPHGPTLYFRILSYGLMREVAGMQRRPRSPGNEYLTAPLLVLNNLPVETVHGKLVCSMLQNMFPTINTGKVRLDEVRRAVLFHHNSQDSTLEFRHYHVSVKSVGTSKSVKRIIRSEIPDLGNFADAAEFVLKAEANLSDSEVEPDSLLALPSAGGAHGRPREAARLLQQRSVTLTECGPRMTLRLIKVADAFNGGKVLYHVPSEQPEATK